MNLDLRTRIGRVWVEGVVGNSPGPRKNLESYREVAKSPASVITCGSYTFKPRKGNVEPRYWVDDNRPVQVGLNAIGLANQGIEKALNEADELKVYGKPIIISIAEESVERFVLMAKLVEERNGFSLELNTSCPNVDTGIQFIDDYKATNELCFQIRRVFSGNLIIKVPAIFNHAQRLWLCNMAHDQQLDAIALINTLGWAIRYDPETLKGLIGAGLGGQSGSSIHPVAVGQTFLFRRQLHPSIDLICEGGVNSGFDLLEFFLSGGQFCRVGTEWDVEGGKIFARVLAEFIDLMNKFGFTSLDDIPYHRGIFEQMGERRATIKPIT